MSYVKPPAILDEKRVRALIPHTIGEHPPNELGVLLCNGHCKWDSDYCGQATWFCLACQYLECYGCGEDWAGDLEEKVYPEFEGYGYNYCRNCLRKDTIIDCVKDFRGKIFK